MSQCLKKLNEKLNFDGIIFCQASLFKIRSAGERVILLSIFRFCLNFSRITLAVKDKVLVVVVVVVVVVVCVVVEIVVVLILISVVS
jgi:hypothetical protein